jgi:2-aminoethylphosphonate-pyruvate transaminase
VRAFDQALNELEAEGGVAARHERYVTNQSMLVQGMEELGFRCLLPKDRHSPFITSFYSPEHPDYNFLSFYKSLKEKGFVIYPGKVSEADCFRIGTIGEVFPIDISRLIQAVADSLYWINHNSS